tara:strand:- start:1138 stop:1320 length:183 start_codon:yes stop_codon:yes gene_type:complete
MAKLVEVEKDLATHEAVCAERYEMILFRINRLERILVACAGILIVGSGSVLSVVIFKLGG